MSVVYGLSPEVRSLLDALGIDGADTRRIIIDVRYDDIVRVYVERLADTSTLRIAADLGAIESVPKKSECLCMPGDNGPPPPVSERPDPPPAPPKAVTTVEIAREK